jgi:hypothetical protein
MIYPVFAGDLALFVVQFFCDDALPIVKMSIILQFFMSLVLVLKWVEYNVFDYASHLNKENLQINIEEERKKLVQSEKLL